MRLPPATQPEAEDSTSGFTELMRRAFAAGLSSFFVTEEALRKALGDTLPRDWAEFASAQSARTRSEVLERLSAEVGRAVESVDWAAVLARLLEGRTLEIRAAIRFGEKTAGGDKSLEVEISRSDEE